MPFIVVMLLFWRDRLAWKYSKIPVDFLLFLCAATNPVVFALAFIYVAFDFLIDLNLRACVKRTISVIAPLTILMVFLLPRMGGKGSIPAELVSANLIKVIVARPLLYPFLFPWYGSLSDTISIVFLVALVSLVWLAYKNSGDKEAKWLILLTASTLITYNLSTIAMRPGLTAFLSSYQTSFPDRYFMGLNVLVVFLVIACLSQLSNKSSLRIYIFPPIMVVFGIYLWNSSYIFEIKSSKMPIKNLFDFSDQVCLSEVSGGNNSLIQIYPEPNWKMTVPSKYINKTNCMYRNQYGYRLD